MSEYKVLIPLDGSRLAERSLAYMPALAKLGKPVIKLFSVAEEPDLGPDIPPGEVVEREYNLLTTYLHEIAADVKKHLGVEVQTGVVAGNTAEKILDQVNAFQPDLMIISTHGRSGILRWRFGSVADKVIRGATCSTLVVGPKTVDRAQWLEGEIEPPFASLLVPVDGSGLSDAALPVTRFLAQHFDSEVHVVQVVTMPPVGDGFGAMGVYTPQLLETLEEAAKENVRTAMERLQLDRLHGTVLFGSPAIELENYAKTHNIDALVMTSHGRGGLVRATLGSVTDRMIGGKAPVLIVRPTTSKVSEGSPK